MCYAVGGCDCFDGHAGEGGHCRLGVHGDDDRDVGPRRRSGRPQDTKSSRAGRFRTASEVSALWPKKGPLPQQRQRGNRIRHSLALLFPASVRRQAREVAPSSARIGCESQGIESVSRVSGRSPPPSVHRRPRVRSIVECSRSRTTPSGAGENAGSPEYSDSNRMQPQFFFLGPL